MPTYHATLRSLRQSPRKVRLLAQAIEGLSMPEAEARLSASVRAPATPLLKLLRSACANAAVKDQIGSVDLLVKHVRVDGGAVLKRFHPRAFGRAAPIRRRSSHITVLLVGRDGAKKGALGPRLPTAEPAGVKPAQEAALRDVGSKGAPSTAGEQQKVQKKIEPKAAQRSFIRRFFQRKSGM